MTQINVQKIDNPERTRPLLPETSALLDKVRNRAFQLFESRGRHHGNELGDWLQAERELFRVPDMELAENNADFQLQLAVPGFDAKDIRVAAMPNAVIVEGDATHQHRGSNGTVHVCEFGERRLFRQIPLPKPVDLDHVSAVLDNGLLQVRAAKAQGRSKAAAA